MRQLTSRRGFLISSVSTLALIPGCSPSADEGAATPSAADADSEVELNLTEEERELVDMVLSEFEQDPGNEAFYNTVAPFEGGGSRKAKIVNGLRTLRNDPGKRWFYWAEDDLATFDYRHLVSMGASVTVDETTEIETGLLADAFELTTNLLQTMVDANYFERAISTALTNDSKAENRVIVALRGAEIVENGTGETGAIMLRDRRPDHRNLNCVFVVWNRAEEADTPLQVFTGSTVPSEYYLALFQSFDGNMFRSCMVPQGFHVRYVGNMSVGRSIHPNTLRQRSACPVIREPSPQRDFFDVSTSVWDPSGPDGLARSVGAHIHAGYWDNKTDPNWVWKFSSAGCQTIQGRVSNDEKSGDIEAFLSAIDLPRAEPEDGVYTHEKYDTNFPMVLLSGREARMHAQGAPISAMRRIRFGSSVDASETPDHPIVKIQAALGVTADGQFGAGSMLKLIDVQRSGTWLIGTAPDGVVTPELAATQDIELT